MDIKHFRLIQTITEEGSIAHSSEKLYLTQSALSHQLKELERQLGFKVFYRSRKKWVLTEEGVELYNLAKTVLEHIDKSLNNIRQIQLGSVGTIKLSTECYSFYQPLPGFIQKMGMLYPEIHVDLKLEATHQPISKILSKEIDIAIVSTKPRNDLLTSIEVYEDEIIAIMHKENTLNKLDFLDSSDFAKVHLIIHSFPLETVYVYEHYLKPHNIMPSKISAIPLTEVALEMTTANFGIMCMPLWTLKSFHLSEELMYKKISKNGLKRSHFLVFRKSDNTKKYIRDFVTNFTEEFQTSTRI